MRLQEVCLITDDVLALAKFYEKVLRTTSEGNEIHTVIKIEGVSFTIYSRKAAKEDMSLCFNKGETNITLGFHVDDVDAEYVRVKALGVEILTKPTTHPWGSRSMQFKDIDGTVITFACRL
ncbi:MAG: hypothetical protein K0S01_870 [Herbinix sp.]|jgi:predicted enzyme related to lactoylglutathione lyase|nr:hypothetical protein [Herbinix sp.]